MSGSQQVKEFPKKFKFGVSTSAYQIEGAWNADNKSESIWDHFTHTHPELIKDNENADVSCDSYHKLREDINNIKALKVHFYRFSISWCRILPTGHTNKINQPGIEYYDKLINELIGNRIDPVATLCHWDLPQCFSKLGGWCNPVIADYFANYARVCFKYFGDRVKTWITINDPIVTAIKAYGGKSLAPGHDSKGIGSYLALHGQLLAHMKAYHVYDKEFRSIQRGRIGLTTDLQWGEAATRTRDDFDASKRFMTMGFAWCTNPVFSKDGDYPWSMQERINKMSKEQGFSPSRLPTFTKEEIGLVRGSSDFMGLNHYTTMVIKHGNIEEGPSNINDMGLTTFFDPTWKNTGSDEYKVVPFGFRKLLNWIKAKYNNPEVIVFENGYASSEHETLYDIDRINYMKKYMAAMLNAILDDHCHVTGYAFWSLMDSFEWQNGYSLKYGLYHVDFKDPHRKRTPKTSAYVYQDIIMTKRLTNPLPEKFLH